MKKRIKSLITFIIRVIILPLLNSRIGYIINDIIIEHIMNRKLEINYNGIKLPANGADGRLGVFRVAWSRSSGDKNEYVFGGDSWVSVIEFGKKVRAKALLSYGNSTEKNSPYNGDQLKLFSKKQLRDVWIYENDIRVNTAKIEKKVGKIFIVQ